MTENWKNDVELEDSEFHQRIRRKPNVSYRWQKWEQWKIRRYKVGLFLGFSPSVFLPGEFWSLDSSSLLLTFGNSNFTWWPMTLSTLNANFMQIWQLYSRSSNIITWLSYFVPTVSFVLHDFLYSFVASWTATTSTDGGSVAATTDKLQGCSIINLLHLGCLSKF